MAAATAATTAANTSGLAIRSPTVPPDVENSSDNSNTLPNSATDDAAITESPVWVSAWSASESTGTMRPSEVADRVTASSSGLRTQSRIPNNIPATPPSANVSA